ncbi:MAG: phosphatidylinositol mannoside acyltransferase [Propionibacteriales bacterium]|nr:phosphatidylinositol mannoside acyltransferase [Propionibacteriales bacterium]
MTTRDRLVDYAFRLGWAVTRHTPEAAASRVLASAADRLWRQHGDGVRQLEANLARAVPTVDSAQLRALSHEAMRSYFRYWHEAFLLPGWSHQRIVDTVVTSNESGFRERFEEGRGGIIALPHMGNWDLAGAWACLTGMPVTAVAERLRPEALYDRFVSYRQELGMEIVSLTGGDNPLSALRDAIRRGRLVCLVADRDLSRSGVQVELLGEPARLPSGPAALARMTGAPLVALTSQYRGPLLRLAFSDVIEVRQGKEGIREMTQQLADFFSVSITAAPQDWHMLQPIFSADVQAHR